MRATASEDEPVAKKGKKVEQEPVIELPSSVFVEITSKQQGEDTGTEGQTKVSLNTDGQSTLTIPSSTTAEQLQELANSLLEVTKPHDINLLLYIVYDVFFHLSL